MVDPEVVRRRLREIDRRVAALRAIAAGERDGFLGDLDLQATTERHLQVAIQAAIDAALHVLADEPGRPPTGRAWRRTASPLAMCAQAEAVSS